MSVRVGIAAGAGASLISARDFWRWVDHCEDSGVDSLWCSDQLLGATLEPMAMLAALAGRTTRIRFGTNALVMPFRDPIVVAKEFAAIDFLSAGRLFPVVGVGAASDAYWQATGAEPKARGRRADEAITLVRLLLEQDEVQFEGVHFRYAGPGVSPRPPRRIPLWIGGQSQAALERTAAIGDGWLGSFVGPDQARAARLGIEAALARTGRTIDPDHYGVTLPMRIGDAGDAAVASARERLLKRLPSRESDISPEGFAVGSAEDIVALLRRHVEAGMSKFVLAPLANDADDLMAQTRLLIRDIVPAIEDGQKAA
jgi:probable F420-dependent oxidoreductase